MHTGTIPLDAVQNLELHDGDVVEGVTEGRNIVVHLIQRKGDDGERATNIDRWLEKWSGAFTEPSKSDDPRLGYLLKKHAS